MPPPLSGESAADADNADGDDTVPNVVAVGVVIRSIEEFHALPVPVPLRPGCGREDEDTFDDPPDGGHP